MEKLINLTPHVIRIAVIGKDGENHTFLEYPPDGTVARVDTVEVVTKHICQSDNYSVPIVQRNYGMVVGIPYDEKGIPVPCIVSSMVLAALPRGTLNVYAPDTGKTAIRDPNGNVYAVTRLVEA